MALVEDSNKGMSSSCARGIIALLAVFLVMTLLALVVAVVLAAENKAAEPTACHRSKSAKCVTDCRLNLVETIPENVTYASGAPVHKSTFDAWMAMLESANETVDVGAFYWTLLDSTGNWSSKQQGEEVYEKLRAVAKRGVRLRIAQTKPTKTFPNDDSAALAKEGLAEVRSVDLQKLIGSGVLHTKFMIVDRKHIYVGSANLDWRALTQVKELGTEALDCPCLAEDLQKVFDTYWMLGSPSAAIPHGGLSDRYATEFDNQHPMDLTPMADRSSFAFLSVAPPQMVPDGRVHDADAIVEAMRNAKEFVRISVMDYAPTTLFVWKNPEYWPVLDDAMRAAAFRGLTVQFLISKWPSTKDTMWGWMHSLAAVNQSVTRSKGRLEVRVFEIKPVTAEQQTIPFARVNHNKYMVTDNTAYIGTSNWAADYFLTTAGVGFTLQSGSGQPRHPFVEQLNQVFLRDWNSAYSRPLDGTD